MNKEQNKVPRWAWGIALSFVIIGLFALMLPTSLSKFSLEASKSANANVDKCYFSSGQNQMVIALEPDKWSCQVITPAGTIYRIDIDHNAKICFIDGECLEVGSSIKNKWVGIKRGIFQIVSSETNKATITIERK